MKNNIAKLRKSKGFSQQEFAEMVGISANWLCHIENGTRRPSLKVVLDIAEKLNVSPREIFLEVNWLQ